MLSACWLTYSLGAKPTSTFAIRIVAEASQYSILCGASEATTAITQLIALRRQASLSSQLVALADCFVFLRALKMLGVVQ